MASLIRNRKDLAKVKRIVVKVGTSTITYPNCSRNFARMDQLCRELADLHNRGYEVILVTSGAVAVGVERLGLKEKPRTIPGKQAAAAVGQGILMHTYEKLFAEYGQIVAQVLLTRTEVLDRHRYANSRNTFMELLKQNVIPIVNENDVVALDDLKIGDNDNMSALVAGIVDADLDILLSDVDGPVSYTHVYLFLNITVNRQYPRPLRNRYPACSRFCASIWLLPTPSK